MLVHLMEVICITLGGTDILNNIDKRGRGTMSNVGTTGRDIINYIGKPGTDAIRKQQKHNKILFLIKKCSLSEIRSIWK